MYSSGYLAFAESSSPRMDAPEPIPSAEFENFKDRTVGEFLTATNRTSFRLGSTRREFADSAIINEALLRRPCHLIPSRTIYCFWTSSSIIGEISYRFYPNNSVLFLDVELGQSLQAVFGENLIFCNSSWRRYDPSLVFDAMDLTRFSQASPLICIERMQFFLVVTAWLSL